MPVALPFGLGLAILCAYWPGFIDPGNGARWLVLLVAAPALLYFCTAFRRGAGIIPPVFLVFCLGSVFYAASYYDALTAAAKLIICAALFIHAVNATEQQRRALIYGCVTGMVLNAIAVLVQLYYGPQQYEALVTVTTVPAGMFVNANYLSEAAAVVAVAVLCHNRIGAMAQMAGLSAALLVLMVSGSMGSVLAVCATVAVAAAVHWRVSGRVIALTATGGVLGALMVLVMGWEFLASDPRFAPRLAMWANVILAGATAFGHGLGSFWVMYPLWDGVAMVSPDTVYNYYAKPRTPHSLFVSLYSDVGVVGLLLFLLMIIRAYGYIFEARRNFADGYGTGPGIRMEVVAGLTASLVVGVTQSSEFFPHTAAFLALFLGYAFSDRDRGRVFVRAGKIARLRSTFDRQPVARFSRTESRRIVGGFPS